MNIVLYLKNYSSSPTQCHQLHLLMDITSNKGNGLGSSTIT